jgi:hypothetical protein
MNQPFCTDALGLDASPPRVACRVGLILVLRRKTLRPLTGEGRQGGFPLPFELEKHTPYSVDFTRIPASINLVMELAGCRAVGYRLLLLPLLGKTCSRSTYCICKILPV